MVNKKISIYICFIIFIGNLVNIGTTRSIDFSLDSTNFLFSYPLNTVCGFVSCPAENYPDVGIENYHYIDLLQYMTDGGQDASFVVMELGTPDLSHTALENLGFTYFLSLNADGTVNRETDNRVEVYDETYLNNPDSVEILNNHATHVCGILHQIAPNANLIYVQIEGQMELRDHPIFPAQYDIFFIKDSAIEGIKWVKNNADIYNIKVLSGSFNWGGYNFDYRSEDLNQQSYFDQIYNPDLSIELSAAYEIELQGLVQSSVTPVFAAGNQRWFNQEQGIIVEITERVLGPAKLNPDIPGLISVGSLSHFTQDITDSPIYSGYYEEFYHYDEGNRWIFSTYSRDERDEIDIMGAGVTVASPIIQNQYATAEGTSQAAPIVAGVALMLSLLGFDPIEIDNLIREYAKPLDIEQDFDTEQYRGQGALDLTGYLCGDFDGDYVENWAEYYYGTDLYNPNTDGDTALDLYGNPVELTDYLEIYWFSSDPTDPNCKPADWDSDEDGLNDWDEYLGRYNEDYNYESTNWFSADSDGDGFTDYEECMGWGPLKAKQESDPNDPTSNPSGFPFVP